MTVFGVKLPRCFVDNYSTVALVAAVSAFGASLTPSLMPRDPLIQALLSGVAAILAYETALLARALWRYMELKQFSPRQNVWWSIVGLSISLGILVFSLSKASSWQNATRYAVDLPPLESGAPFLIFFLGALIATIFWLLFRGLGSVRRIVSSQMDRLVPPKVGVVLSICVVGWFFWALIDGALVRNAFKIADASFMAADILIEPNIAKPTDPQKTGSAESLVRWDQIGRLGRQFVATAPTSEEISVFNGDDIQQPIRVYVGRQAADTPKKRAQIAFDELKRVGGFDRSVLVVAVPVGTGWMDPHAHDTLDFMLGGDVATVAVQYSYLTSALSLMAHPEYGVEQAEALFDIIYEYWSTLPKGQRPRLYVYGLSQGAFNSQATLNFLDMLADPIQGALWVGSPFFSNYWSEVRDDRKPSSPAWRPKYGNGSLIRVMDQYGGLDEKFSPWGPIRVVFLNYGSDPIVNFTFDSSLFQPAWLDMPRAPDVSDQLNWFPMITMLQLALDSAFSLKVPRFGHLYIAEDYIDAWAAVVNPDGWTTERADKLKEIFSKRAAASEG
ncbi:MAG: alpha/beta-hydrolase family protein [Roseibium sp.]